uniref:Uncharacterized protein n=1 Tax=Plectus sambesii TaxID=2011161 RepID=A0A914V2E6_9BILA
KRLRRRARPARKANSDYEYTRRYGRALHSRRAASNEPMDPNNRSFCSRDKPDRLPQATFPAFHRPIDEQKAPWSISPYSIHRPICSFHSSFLNEPRRMICHR